MIGLNHVNSLSYPIVYWEERKGDGKIECKTFAYYPGMNLPFNLQEMHGSLNGKQWQWDGRNSIPNIQRVQVWESSRKEQWELKRN